MYHLNEGAYNNVRNYNRTGEYFYGKTSYSYLGRRQITIPVKYFKALGLSDEVDCIYTNDMLILTPVRGEVLDFAEEILSDLIKQEYSGLELLNEFKRINRQVRPAIEELIEEADPLAKAASESYTDRTDDIFGNDDESEA